MAHACDPSYSGGRDLEDWHSKPALGKEFARPYLEKNPTQKRAGGVAQGVSPEFKPQYHIHKTNAVYEWYSRFLLPFLNIFYLDFCFLFGVLFLGFGLILFILARLGFELHTCKPGFLLLESYLQSCFSF
jgi:hypothetical protein